MYNLASTFIKMSVIFFIRSWLFKLNRYVKFLSWSVSDWSVSPKKTALQKRPSLSLDTNLRWCTDQDFGSRLSVDEFFGFISNS